MSTQKRAQPQRRDQPLRHRDTENKISLSTKNLRVFASRWPFLLRALCILGISAACRRTPAPAPPLVAQTSGTFEAAGLSASVRIVRDRWGVAHVYAQNQDDLFFAQGFVQAEDRLFQMDLWRRSVQGRLSEVLGPNFDERDVMTRRMQYRGDLDTEWASYGPDTRAIAAAFTRGINAWAARARERPPEEFVLAGWIPELWSPIDLLNRTDAFVASGDAVEEVSRQHLSEVIADAIRRVGTQPFFMGLAAPVRVKAGTSTDVTGVASVPPAAHARIENNPSRRYLIHLSAPGWNVIGLTSPWLPGVAIGHNDRIAWNLDRFDADTQDVYSDPAGSSMTSVIKDAIVVRGRAKPFGFDIERTPHGVVVATDRARNLVFTVRWSGTEAGGAAELGAMAIDRARSWTEFRAAAARWKMPPRKIVYADVDGHSGFQAAALVPIRRASEWVGWRTLDSLPHAFNARDRTALPPAPAGEPVVFAHPLGITAASRRRFDVGPLMPRAPRTAPFGAAFDPADWDRSHADNPPGQSGSPDSAHFADLATLWAAGESVPLAFTDAAVQANAETTLMLIPLR